MMAQNQNKSLNVWRKTIMSSTQGSLYYHLVFNTHDRLRWIDTSWQEPLAQYIGGIVRDIKGIAIEIGGDSDHSHILAGLKANYCISDSLRIIKSGSSKWVHESIGLKSFQWQVGYGAFTIRSSDVEVMRGYIKNQREHHRKKTFQEEYIELLKEYGIEFDERYLW
jgi:putative transposase